MTALLYTKDLSKQFGGMKAVSEVNLEIQDGEIHCLIGPNGAGKSTMFKLIVGYHEPDKGQIFFDDVELTQMKAFARVQRGMSIKMQKPSVFKELPTRLNLHVALQQRLAKKDIAIEEERLLSLLDLESQADKPAGLLSHGQQQWLEIGMALALRPRLVLLDEPTAGMSDDETFRTGELIKRLNKDGMTILAVEHDMSFVRQIADSVTVMHLGEVFARGNIDDIVADERVGEIYLGNRMAEELALQVTGLRAGYGATPILQGVDMAIAPGEIVALIGRNGVGKTTTVRALIGLIRSSGGTVRLNGTDVTSKPADARARLGMGYIPQGRDVFPRMTVSENLTVGELIGGPGGRKLREFVFELFPRLAERRRQVAGTMSGGEQQQLAIGRALIGSPNFMLLDEPSEGVQPSIVEMICEALQKIRTEIGTTILFVEQNLDTILSIAERCYVMEKGRIVSEIPSGKVDAGNIREHLLI